MAANATRRGARYLRQASGATRGRPQHWLVMSRRRAVARHRQTGVTARENGTQPCHEVVRRSATGRERGFDALYRPVGLERAGKPEAEPSRRKLTRLNRLMPCSPLVLHLGHDRPNSCIVRLLAAKDDEPVARFGITRPDEVTGGMIFHAVLQHRYLKADVHTLSAPPRDITLILERRRTVLRRPSLECVDTSYRRSETCVKRVAPARPAKRTLRLGLILNRYRTLSMGRPRPANERGRDGARAMARRPGLAERSN